MPTAQAVAADRRYIDKELARIADELADRLLPIIQAFLAQA